MTVTLYRGDCLEILPTLTPQSIDAIITDLPYGTTRCAWDEVIPLDQMWKEIARILTPNGVFITTAHQPFTGKLIMSNPKWYRHEWVWDKKRATNWGNAHRAPMRAHESIVVFAQRSPKYFPQMQRWTDEQIKRKRKTDVVAVGYEGTNFKTQVAPSRDRQVERGRFPDTVLRIPALGSIDRERCGHPTQKPVALYEYLVKTYTNASDIVLDFCMGSGTTGVACINTGRRFVGVEKDERYFAIAQRRIQDAQAQPQLFGVPVSELEAALRGNQPQRQGVTNG